MNHEYSKWKENIAVYRKGDNQLFQHGSLHELMALPASIHLIIGNYYFNLCKKYCCFHAHMQKKLQVKVMWCQLLMIL